MADQPQNNVSRLASVQQAEEQKQTILQFRDEFFNDLLEEWSRPPEAIDRLMGQSDSFFLPDFKNAQLKNNPETVMIKDIRQGLLAVSVTPPQAQFGSGSIRWVYSILQAGDWLRYGILVQGDPKLILQYERHHDHVLSIERIWDRQCDYQFRDSGGLLLEWRFHEPDFYTEYKYRERFKIIARHLHFRLGKIISPLFDESETYSRSEDNGREDLSSGDSDTVFGSP